MNHLERLESQSIYILREAFSSFQSLAMLWSAGKDSNVILWLARKAFFGHVPFPMVYIDTGYEMPELLAFRDKLVRDWKLNLIISQNVQAFKEGQTFPAGKLTRVQCCGVLKKEALKQTLDRHRFQGLIVGVRRDEEPTRAKERVFSPRTATMQWEIEDQPPELWDQFNTEVPEGAHIRIHPLLHWTESNIWEYTQQERIPVPELYFDHGTGQRYRSLGCHTCTGGFKSTAKSVAEIIEELQKSRVSERAGRAHDHESEDAFEKLRRDGFM
ncbi:MAG: sulfate adenylyltransferase subunit 2 sulfate adenylatetransferase sat ATP-sulfurylase small subunit [Verrucomicrobiales bacterium]|nr:sulfate adenylyltransferase subunit 2 sulfate adenylatetransferase sat ATP-sulfurylase small subunit [Verrucomicrobiales bacterium]